jgi:hypothetical protein
MIVNLEKLKELIQVNKMFSDSVELEKFKQAVELVEIVAEKTGLSVKECSHEIKKMKSLVIN